MNTENYRQQLLAFLLNAHSEASLEQRLEALLTPGELSEIEKRLQIVKLLQKGVGQRAIAKSLGVGIATVTRGSRELQAGKFQGLLSDDIS